MLSFDTPCATIHPTKLESESIPVEPIISGLSVCLQLYYTWTIHMFLTIPVPIIIKSSRLLLSPLSSLSPLSAASPATDPMGWKHWTEKSVFQKHKQAQKLGLQHGGKCTWIWTWTSPFPSFPVFLLHSESKREIPVAVPPLTRLGFIDTLRKTECHRKTSTSIWTWITGSQQL